MFLFQKSATATATATSAETEVILTDEEAPEEPEDSTASAPVQKTRRRYARKGDADQGGYEGVEVIILFIV